MSHVLQIASDRQLFVDDYMVEETRNLQRTFHQPVKYVGNPIIRPLAPWEGHAVNVYGTVMYDQGMYRMWYQAYGGTPFTACYATSKDGIFWDKPSLGLIEFAGSKDNNLFLMDVSPFNVIKDGRGGDPSQLYKALFYEHHNPSVSVAFSPDGVHWTKYEGNPVLKGTSDVHMLLGWDDKYNQYVTYMRPGSWGERHVRVIGRSVSDDFIHWSEPEVVMAPDKEDPPGLEFYGMPVFKYQGVYFGLPSAYHTYPEEPAYWRKAGLTDVQLAISRDGIHWQRAGERKSFIPRGGPGTIDQGAVSTAKEPVQVGDELWFYYGGYIVDHGITEDLQGRRAYSFEAQRGVLAQRGGFICLAKLRLDGFIAMDAGEEEGTLLTKPFRCEGEELVINAAARGGYVAVAVLDETGQHIGDYFTGFKKIDCALFDGDSVRHKVTWRDNTSLASLKGQVIRLKFYLRSAQLYSFAVL